MSSLLAVLAFLGPTLLVVNAICVFVNAIFEFFGAWQALDRGDVPAVRAHVRTAMQLVVWPYFVLSALWRVCKVAFSPDPAKAREKQTTALLEHDLHALKGEYNVLLEENRALKAELRAAKNAFR